MKKGVIAGIVAIALAGIVAASIPFAEKFASAVIKAEIERGGTATVGRVEVGFLARRVVLADIRSSQGAGMSVGRWEASGLGWPLAELLQGRTPLGGFRWGSPLQADRIELQRVHLGDWGAGGTWSVEALVLEGLDLARFDASEDGPYRDQVVLARAMTALSVRRVEQNGTVFAMSGSGDTFAVSKIVVERYEAGRMASAMAVGVEATAGRGRAPLFRVADIDVRGLDVRRNLVALSSADWHHDAPLGRVGVDRANASGFSGDTLARYGASLGSVNVETVHDSDQVSRTRARIEGFVLAPPLRNMEALKLRMALQAMGLRELRLGFDCAGTDDRVRGEITIDRCALAGPDLANINFTARIAGADDAFWQAVDDGDLAALYDTKAVLTSARLVAADGGLLERAFKAFAVTTGQPASVVRTNFARDVRRFQPADVLITQDLSQLLDAVARFVEKGGTLTVDARPEPPLAIDRIDYLTSPGADLVTALGLTATLSK